MYKKIIFSGISGAIATTCIYPLACTKTRLQAEEGKMRTSPLAMMRLIVKEGGWAGLYRGWPPNVLLVMPEKAIKLTANDYFRRKLKGWRGKGPLTISWEMAAGALAGCVQVVATCPSAAHQLPLPTAEAHAAALSSESLTAALLLPFLLCWRIEWSCSRSRAPPWRKRSRRGTTHSRHYPPLARVGAMESDQSCCLCSPASPPSFAGS